MIIILQAIFNFLISVFFWLVGVIGSLLFYPIQAIIVAVFPDFGDFVVGALSLFNNYIFPMLSFVKEVILDVSCVNRTLYSIFIAFVIGRWAIAPAIRSTKLLLNTWKVKSGGVTK